MYIIILFMLFTYFPLILITRFGSLMTAGFCENCSNVTRCCEKRSCDSAVWSLSLPTRPPHSDICTAGNLNPQPIRPCKREHSNVLTDRLLNQPICGDFAPIHGTSCMRYTGNEYLPRVAVTRDGLEDVTSGRRRVVVVHRYGRLRQRRTATALRVFIQRRRRCHSATCRTRRLDVITTTTAATAAATQRCTCD